jgi:hypothetical protein
VKKGLLVLMMLIGFVFSIQSTSYADSFEPVYVYKVNDLDYKAIIIRANGEAHLIEYGVGAISIWRYESKVAYVSSPGLFAGIGSSIVLPNEQQTARIWDDQYLGNVNQ